MATPRNIFGNSFTKAFDLRKGAIIITARPKEGGSAEPGTVQEFKIFQNIRPTGRKSDESLTARSLDKRKVGGKGKG
jgi:hypothetical protein